MDIQKKSQQYQFFLDISGSVSGSDNYWDTVKNILQEYGPEIDNFYLWDTSLMLVGRKEVEDLIVSKRGRGGTCPSIVAQQCVLRDVKNIILITDGQIGSDEVTRCNITLSEHKFNKSICYIISTASYSSYGGYGNRKTDMSVSCAFTRHCQHKVFKKDYQSPLILEVNFSQEDFLILDTLGSISLETFEAQYDKLQGLIISLNMGMDGNIPLKNDLLLMKNRLIFQLAKKKEGDKKDLSTIIREFLLKNDFQSAMNQMQQACKNYIEDNTGAQLENKITHLISLCGDLTQKFDLGEIKSNKMLIAKDAKKGEIDQNAQLANLSSNPIQCPILYEDDVPQILVDECEPLLTDVPKSIVDDINACPLRILNYPDLKAKLKSKLSNYIGVMGIKAKFDKNLVENPFTRKRILGAIPLGTDKSHVKVGNYTIAKLIAGGKIMGNLNMYYAVIWYLIQDNSIEYLKDIQPNATEHLLYRMTTSKTYASLCGKAQFVSTRVSTDIALWYCVNSGYLNLPQDRDTFRFHFYEIQPMIKILEALSYPNDKNLMAHYNRTNALFNFLSVYKTMKSQHDKKTLQNLLIGLYQNGVFINPKELSKKFVQTETCSTFIPVDGQATEQQVEKIRTLLGEKYKFTQSLTNEELYFMAKLADPKKNISEYFLDYNLEIPPLPQHETNWKYGLNDVQHPKICPKTLRPYYQQSQSSSLESTDLTLKEYKYFQAFVFKYEKLPTVDELLLFYYNLYIQAGKTHTLPFMVEKWTRELIEEYKPHFEQLTVKKVKKVLNEFRPVEKRVKVETGN